MKDSPSPPPAPDPTATAGAQTQSNIQTAIANARLNRVNQQTPWGSINYTQGPVDANGVPSYSSDISLSPAQQQLLEQQQGMSTSRNTIAQHLLERAGTSLGQPLDLSHAHGVYDRYAPQGGTPPAGAMAPAGGGMTSGMGGVNAGGGMPGANALALARSGGLGGKGAALQPPNPNPAARGGNPLMPGGGGDSGMAAQLAQLLQQRVH